MVESPVPRLLVMDTGPLITLAVAEALDYLLLPDFPVVIPDAVFFEATRKSDALGAADITEWAQTHADRVSIVPTSVYVSEIGALEGGVARVRDLGERSALEVIRYTPFATEHEVAILLTEDDAIIRGRFISPNERRRIVVITTHDFLEGLEQAQRINSVAEIYRRANDGGRLASEKKTKQENHKRALDALAQALKTNGPKP